MFFFVAVAIVIGAYVVGSFPTGYIVAYMAGVSDIRQHGSGNIGATNVARVVALPYFIPVFLIDAAKAAGYLMMIKAYEGNETFVAFVALIILFGNSYSIFLNFTGGKGVSTIVGLLYVLNSCIFLILAPVWVMALLITRSVGVASVIACASLVMSSYYVMPTYAVSCACIVMGLWAIGRHKDNLKDYALAYGWCT